MKRGGAGERDDYLWDRSGPVDLELERIERKLRPLAWKDSAGEPDWRRVTARRLARGRRRRTALLLAAGLALFAIGVASWLAIRPLGASWSVESLSPGATIDGRPIAAHAELRRGQTLATGNGARVRLGIGWLGTVEVDPGAELAMVRASAKEHRLRLERGTLQARIAAPPRWFAVDTPAAAAIDMGCSYTLTVEAGGEGRLAVDTGWVALVGQGRESYLPHGSHARIVAGHGPGTPIWDDAPLALDESVATLDGAWRVELLDAALAAARPRDALTLWHLLARAPAADRARIAERLAAAAPPPAADTVARAVAGDRAALDAWWESLGLGGAEWWRNWRQPLPES